MKKAFSLTLAVVLLLTLCVGFAGCGQDDIRGTVATSPTAPSSPASPTNPSAPTDPEFALGATTDRVYKNDFLGISCTIPADWEIFTDAQILELNSIVGNYTDKETAELLKNANIVYDMYAQYLPEGSSISINMEKLSALQLVSLNIQQVLESQISTIVSSYENMGYTDVNVEYRKVTVDGKELDSLYLTAKIQGYDFFLTVLSFRKSNYLANITIGSLYADKVDEIIGCFTIQ